MKDNSPTTNDRRPMIPNDPCGADRAERQARLGLRPESDAEYDTFADELRDHVGGPDGAMMAGISLVRPGGDLYFIGLSKRADLGPIEAKDRVMERGVGFCPVVAIERQRPLAINTADHVRHSTNPAAAEFGVASYLGDAVDDADGEPVLTVWIVDDKEHEWKRVNLDYITGMARKLKARIIERAEAQ